MLEFGFKTCCVLRVEQLQYCILFFDGDIVFANEVDDVGTKFVLEELCE